MSNEIKRKKKVLYHSDFALAASGFGRATRALLSYLYRFRDSIEVINYCCGMDENNPLLAKTPWKSIGCIPENKANIAELLKDPASARAVSYGSYYYLEQVMAREKVDIFVGSQDLWAFSPVFDMKWFQSGKVTTAMHWTLDSLPLLPEAIQRAPQLKNIWVWSSFAEKELHRLGYKHAKTVHAPLETKHFYRLPNHQRMELRKQFNIDQNCFVVGAVFRNQLRKLVANMVQGFALFKKENPKANAKLFFHTSFSEPHGWDIPRILEEYNIKREDLLVTYVCGHCKNFTVKPFEKDGMDCPFCGVRGTFSTPTVGGGRVTEEQLNLIYNLMDAYLGIFSSGGTEVPILESKLSGCAISLVSPYSCGEELCQEGSGTFAVDWAEYRECGTNFRKCSPYPSSISKNLTKIYNLPAEKRREICNQAREWVLKNYDIEVVGKFFKDFIDAAPFSTYEYNEKPKLKNPNYSPPEGIISDKEWVLDIYKNILGMENLTENDSGVQHWLSELRKADSN